MGRDKPGGDAISLLEIDEPLDSATLEKVRALPHIRQVKPLKF